MTIPVLVVAGFLGSGKTSLLNHLLHTTSGLRIGVIVNDFGRVNIDAMTIAAQVDAMVSLGNGCLCCAVDASELDEMIGRLALPEDAPVDVIVIEASGLAEPPAMVRMVLASDNPFITYGGLVEVVDAAEFESTRARHPQVDNHLRYADLVLLNKIDRVDEPTRDALLDLVRGLAEGIPVVPTEHGRVDPALLFDPVDRPEPAWRQLSFEDLEEREHHVHADYDSVDFATKDPVHPQRFAQFLTDRPVGVYRMKGFVDFAGTDQRFTVHTVGSYVSVTTDPWPDSSRATELVLIGADLDAELITSALDATVEPDPAAVDQLAMVSITRYLRD
ncbi:MAG: GTP-binding protein [Actinomycetota bacterium]|nr:GTP-binding protein [Actinomycetota bacterium]